MADHIVHCNMFEFTEREKHHDLKPPDPAAWSKKELKEGLLNIYSRIHPLLTTRPGRSLFEDPTDPLMRIRA